MTTKERLVSALGDGFDPTLGRAKAELHLGKLDRATGFRNHVVDVQLTLHWPTIEFAHGQAHYYHPEFSVMGEVINTRKRTDDNIDAFGQIQTELDGMLSDPRWNDLKRVWDAHHLNAVNAECTHMRALGWLPPKGQPMPTIEIDGRTAYIGHVYPAEHPQGILGKKCPECGIGYGTQWNYEPIPDEDLWTIIELMASADKETK